MTNHLNKFGLYYKSGPLPSSEHDGFYVFSVVRNEMLRLPYFLKFYRDMGISLFIVADNQSDDGTNEYLSNQPDVLLLEAPGSYSESKCGIDWLNAMLHSFGQNRWCLSVDADELLVYPHCEKISLSELTRYLESKGANALPVFLLDMYSKKAMKEAFYQSGTPFIGTCPYFDASGYMMQETDGPTCHLPSRGGPRERLFWKGRNREMSSPFLPKIPLVRWSRELRYKSSTHNISKIKVCNVSGILLHFKFFAEFAEQVEVEVHRQEHYEGASEYLAYWEVAEKDPTLSAYYEGSVRFVDSRQLLHLDLMHSSKSFNKLGGMEEKGILASMLTTFVQLIRRVFR